jgi:inorganic triphosphatase YgiF
VEGIEVTGHEIEAKFECMPDAAACLRTLSELAGFRLQSTLQRVQADTYFDSTERVLRASSATLRLRRIGDDALLATFKGPREMLDAGGAQMVKRREIEHPVHHSAGASMSGDHLPGLLKGTEALREVEAAFGAVALVPVARIETRRELRRFGDDDVPELELAVDQSVGIRLSDDRRVEFVEVELESLTGDVSALRAAIVALLDACPGLEPSEQTKLGRTLD